MLLQNSHARRGAYPADLREILKIDTANESHAWLNQWSHITPTPTPCWSLPDLAATLGVDAIYVKDESKRSSLESFKALGAPVALVRLAMRVFPDAGFTAAALFRGEHRAALGAFTVISATDGNHGRALAAGARSIGCRCVIIIHRHVSEERRIAIEHFGAEVIRIDGTYDESVQEAARVAEANAWHVVSDTSYEGYQIIPRDVMQGYGAIAAEVIACEGVPPNSACPYSHVVIQGGVGGLAAGIISYMCEYFGSLRPIFIMVEPEQADCLYQSALQGMAAHASGSVDSVMAGLACGDTSPLAWRFLEHTVDHFLTITDDAAIQAMKLLAKGSPRDIPIVSGESGAAGLAGLISLAASVEWRKSVGLTSASRVLVVNTEGATAPALFEELVGCSANDVLAAQKHW
jgi:diaminopropionate ammonia-lyase